MTNSNLLFKSQVFSKREIDTVLRNNVLIDLFFGHANLLESLSANNNDLKRELDYIKTHIPLRKINIDGLKQSSLLMFLLMLSGNCNANCEICYTDRKCGPDSLSQKEIAEIVQKAYEMGVKTLYIPGEGEPLLDPNFIFLLEISKKLGLEIIIFSNGILFSNELLCQKQFKCSTIELINKLKKYHLSIYFKLWSFDPSKVSEMMGIDAHKCFNYVDFKIGNKKTAIPKGLFSLLNIYPRERIGIETVLEKRNTDEIGDYFMPFIKQENLKFYMEPIIHSGRYSGLHKYDVNERYVIKYENYLQRLQCQRIGYSIAIFNDATISFCIGHSRSQDFKDSNQLRDKNGLKDIFHLIHTSPFIIKARYYKGPCLCEILNNNPNVSPFVVK